MKGLRIKGPFQAKCHQCGFKNKLIPPLQIQLRLRESLSSSLTECRQPFFPLPRPREHPATKKSESESLKSESESLSSSLSLT